MFEYIIIWETPCKQFEDLHGEHWQAVCMISGGNTHYFNPFILMAYLPIDPLDILCDFICFIHWLTTLA